VFDEKYLKDFYPRFMDWYSNMDKDPEVDPLWETYLVISYDSALMTYTKPRTVKTMKRFIIKQDFYDKLIAGSAIVRRT
jgi:hypothetical protein